MSTQNAKKKVAIAKNSRARSAGKAVPGKAFLGPGAADRGGEPAASAADPQGTHATAAEAAEPVIAEARPAGVGPMPRVGLYPREAVITLLAASNPRHGAAGERFARFRTGETVGQFLAAGGTRRDVRKAVKRGWIKLSISSETNRRASAANPSTGFC